MTAFSSRAAALTAAALLPILGGCAAPVGGGAAPASDLALELRWVGAAGEMGELRLEGGRIQARLARRQLGALPIYDSVYETELAPRALRRLGRRLEASGVFDVPEALEDGAGRARSLSLQLRHEGRTIRIRSRASRCAELDRALDLLDEHCEVPVFASLPEPPGARSRPAWRAEPERAFEFHRRLLEARRDDRGLALDLALLARDVERTEERARFLASLGGDAELRRILEGVRAQHATPIR